MNAQVYIPGIPNKTIFALIKNDFNPNTDSDDTNDDTDDASNVLTGRSRLIFTILLPF